MRSGLNLPVLLQEQQFFLLILKRVTPHGKLSSALLFRASGTSRKRIGLPVNESSEFPTYTQGNESPAFHSLKVLVRSCRLKTLGDI
uniref:Uncharacterized protein n=1 Tax=Oryza brachyantha TaxID=4533 RepID=J3M023_ORYBR